MQRMTQQTAVFILLLALLLAGPVGVGAHHSAGEDPLDDVYFEQRLDEALPLELTFRDEMGTAVRLGDYFGQKPVVMNLGYYECPKLCDLVFAGMADSLSRIDGLTMGQDYQVISVSIDPGETPAAARQKEALHVRQYGRSGAEAGWHFLTGDEAAITTLAEAVGFHYVYDAAKDEYAHPSGMVLLTPQGVIARYFMGIEYAPRDVRLSLVEASAGKVGSPVDQLLLLCYRYDPATGQYTPLIMNGVRLAGIAVAGVVGMAVFFMLRQERRQQTIPRPRQERE